MPTGFTSDINAGTTFAQFAIACARAFGACITMRDDPHDAPIPEEFTPDPYYTKSIEDDERRLAELRAMSDADKERGALEAYQAACRHHAEAAAKSEALERNYRRILDEVRRWKPPTVEHRGLKDFMIQQLEESIRFDCHTPEEMAKYYPQPKRQLPGDWWDAQILEAERSLARSKKSLQGEQERAAGRTAWVKALRESLR